MSIEVISASAGAGKTYILATEMEAAIGKGEARPDAVVAITYTNKAAAELARRLRQRLLEGGKPVEAARIRDGYLGTIHSVCQRLIADLAFEAGSSPYPEPAPKSYSDQLFKEVVGVETGEAMKALSDLVASLALETNESVSRFGRTSWRDVLRKIVSRSRENRLDSAVLTQSANASIQELKQLLGTSLGNEQDRDEKLFATVDAIHDWAVAEERAQVDSKGKATKTMVSQIAWIRDVRRLLQRGKRPSWVKLTDTNAGLWGAKKYKPVIGDMQEQVDRHLSHSRFQSELEEIQSALFGHASAVSDAFETRKKAERLVDFEDMLAEAAKILRTDAAKEQLAGRIDLVMVDEFQDTSPVQLEVVMALSALAKRTVWVGDKKQGIFGFQGSDPSLMEAAMTSVLEGQAPRLLGYSYRSRPPLVKFCSELFAAALAPHGFERNEVVLQPACPEPPSLEGSHALQLWSTIRDTERPDDKHHEANGIARHIERVLKEQALLIREESDNPTAVAPTRVVRAGDFAVLARTNATCGRIAGALEARGIKALVAEKGLRGTPEALLTRAGLAMLADPTDRLAAAEIAWFTGSAPNPSEWLSERITAYKKHRKDKTEDVAYAELPVLQALRELAKTADKLSPAEAVVAVFSAMNLPEQTLSWSDPYRHFANLEALRAVAADYQAICGARRSAATIAGLVQHLDGLSADHEQALPVVADAVRVLTYHKAKGLEWPVVVCAELDKAFDTSPFDVRVKPADDFDANNPLEGREIRWWPWPYGKKSTGLELKDKAAETDIAKLLAHQSKAENARLLYVGFTRARDHLVLSKFAARRGGLRWLEMLEDAEGEPLLSLPWNDAGAQQITLGDHRFDCEVQSEVGTVSLMKVQHEQQVSWFARPESKTERKRQRLSPSAQVLSSQLAAQVRIAEVVNIGAHTALAVRAEQMAQVGETLHGFLAADLGPGSDGRKELAERLIKHWGLDGQLAVSTLIEMADRFRTWVDSHAPGVRLPEWPVRWLREDGRAMSGDIDLLVPLESGWLLLDHKSFPGGREDRDAKLVKWAGQLDAYRGAVEAATGQPVTELWVHLPMRGEVVRLEIPRAG